MCVYFTQIKKSIFQGAGVYDAVSTVSNNAGDTTASSRMGQAHVNSPMATASSSSTGTKKYFEGDDDAGKPAAAASTASAASAPAAVSTTPPVSSGVAQAIVAVAVCARLLCFHFSCYIFNLLFGCVRARCGEQGPEMGQAVAALVEQERATLTK